jgi:hypothetical protein
MGARRHGPVSSLRGRQPGICRGAMAVWFQAGEPSGFLCQTKKKEKKHVRLGDGVPAISGATDVFFWLSDLGSAPRWQFFFLSNLFRVIALVL